MKSIDTLFGLVGSAAFIVAGIRCYDPKVVDNYRWLTAGYLFFGLVLALGLIVEWREGRKSRMPCQKKSGSDVSRPRNRRLT